MIDFELETQPFMACEPEEIHNVNRELNLAWEIVEETGANLFLTGRAGTGKTTFLKNLLRNSSKRMVVLAPTGVAAINAGGNTIHSFFQLPFAPFVPGKGFVGGESRYYSINKHKKRLISSLSLLVIDEISMVRPDTLDAIDQILRRIRSNSRPFGGVQLLLIGDLRQLPPVVREDEWNLIQDCYSSPYFFESHALREAGYQTLELSVVYRQSDTRFLDILNAIRDGKADSHTLQLLNRRYIPTFSPSDSEGYIRLMTHNYQAAAINDSRLNELPGPEFSFEAEVSGEFPESSYPAEKYLRLRRGTQVMFIKNDTGSERRFYNGLIGIVTEVSDERIIVMPHEGASPIEVERMEWENTRYAVDEASKAIVQQTVGRFRQYPLQLAWAITIHKSQGLTFDKAIIDSARSFAPGQTYVALSRCRSLEGLVLSSPVPPQAVIVDRNVNDFISYCEQNRPDDERIFYLKQQYSFDLLARLFDFDQIRKSFETFARYVREYLVPLHGHLDGEIREWQEKIDSALWGVGNRFIASNRGHDIAAEISSKSTGLGTRIKNGCDYFLNILEDMLDFLSSLATNIDNQEYASRLNNSYETLKYFIDLKILLLRHIGRHGFGIPIYQTGYANAVLTLNREAAGHRAGYFKKTKEKTVKEKKPKGYSAFETLKLFREGKSIAEIAEERNLKGNTIAGHIADLIEMGKIEQREVDDDEIFMNWSRFHNGKNKKTNDTNS